MKIISEKHTNSLFINVANPDKSTVGFWCQGIAQKIIFLSKLESNVLKNFYAIPWPQVWYQSGMKATVSGVFEDLQFKISEGSDSDFACSLLKF